MLAVEVLDQREVDHGLEHGHLDVAALPVLAARHQRDQDGLSGVERAGLVADDGGQVGRLAALQLAERGQAAQALDDVVVSRATGIGAALGKTVHRHHHQPGVARAQQVRRQAQGNHLLRPHAVDQHVGAVDQQHQGIAGRRLLQVEHHAALAAVGAYEGGRHARLHGRAGGAGRVATGRFDLDDVGAVVAQHLRGIGAEHDGGHVQDADAGQRPGGGEMAHGALPSRYWAALHGTDRASSCTPPSPALAVSMGSSLVA